MTDHDSENWLGQVYRSFGSIERSLGYQKVDGISEPTSLLPVMVTARWRRTDLSRMIEVTFAMRKTGEPTVTVALRNDRGETAALEQVYQMEKGETAPWTGLIEGGQAVDAYIRTCADEVLNFLASDCASIVSGEAWIVTPFDWAGYR